MSPIQFRCSNIVSYDAASEAYVRCDCELTAPANEIAKYVRCPKCNSQVLVPPQTEISGSGNKAVREVDPARGARAALEATVPSDVPTKSLVFSAFDAKHRCNRCGGSLGENYRCVVCGYQTILLTDVAVGDEVDVRPAGCQLWLAQKLAHGIAVQSLVLAAHSFVAIVLIILVTAAFGLGGGAAWIVLIAAVVFASIYLHLVLASRRIARRPPARLNVWQRFLWNLVLFVYRMRGWRPGNSAFTWRVLDIKNRPFDDRQITSLPNLTSVQVLDLEGTGLTDAGLLKLQGLKGLQRLVVRRTNVTQEAVFALQQRLPQTWIWN